MRNMICTFKMAISKNRPKDRIVRKEISLEKRNKITSKIRWEKEAKKVSKMMKSCHFMIRKPICKDLWKLLVNIPYNQLEMIFWSIAKKFPLIFQTLLVNKLS